MKMVLNKKGLLFTVVSVLFLLFVFVSGYPEAIIRIPSPEFEKVRRFYWWIIMFGCGFLAVTGVVLWTGKEMKSWLYPITLVGLGLFYMLVLPPFSAPDESAHFVSAYRLSSVLMGKEAVAGDEFYAQASEEEKERIERGANVLVRTGDDADGLYAEIGQRTYEMVLTDLFSHDESQGVTVRYEIPVNTSPVVYLPQAIGISLARALHLGYVPLLYLGRLCNLLAFAAMTFWAVTKMPFKKEILMAAACLPMTLNLASSYSYDASFLGLSMMLLAWCFHLAFEKKEVTLKDTLVLAVLLILLEPGKLVYLPVAGLALMIPADKFRSRKHYWISVISVLLALFTAIYVVNHIVLSAWATESHVGWNDAAGYTLSDVFGDPYNIFTMYYETLVTQSGYYMTTMLGGFLGNLDADLTVPPFCLAILWCVLFICAVRRTGEEAVISGRQKLWMLLLVFLSASLVLASMLIGWTPREMTYITGVQGRYFIPLLPLVLLCIYDKKLVLDMDLRKSAWYLECFVSIYALIRICSTASLRY